MMDSLDFAYTGFRMAPVSCDCGSWFFGFSFSPPRVLLRYRFLPSTKFVPASTFGLGSPLAFFPSRMRLQFLILFSNSRASTSFRCVDFLKRGSRPPCAPLKVLPT